ncbi:MAG: hypothetical protein SOX43_04740 [Pelistega sp.]|nr:hypothetical protein [Pelistega sp.]
MITLNKTKEFESWLHSVKDKIAKTRILSRLRNASLGNFGHTKSVGGGIFEMKIDVGARLSSLLCKTRYRCLFITSRRR